MKIIINGRFLTQNITGVQRFAHEIVNKLDKFMKKDEIVILVPKNLLFKNLKYENIEIKKIGFLRGYLWEQLELPYYVWKTQGRLVNLCNTAPIINTGIVIIHDISTKVNSKFYSKKFSIFYNILNKIITKTSIKILTVSEFSKKEIMKYYNINSSKIDIVYNAWQHMERIIEDRKILEKLRLKNKKFYLGVSSINPNKNFKYIIELAKLYPEKIFVIVGKLNQKVFGNMNLEKIDNIVWAGYITDEELKALYKNTLGFIYPSFYEGFGIPPMEALACGCKKVYVSDTSCLPEIFEDSVIYLNPYKVEKILNEREAIKEESIKKVLNKYSWEKSIKTIINIINDSIFKEK
ncbi:glycosyltransferase family 4 protein [Fusobacterium varium]|uniref:glycosyltransferase family 4 protein n=1 Tax=Fusobacterium varium TaxID=856 RepID=UPI00242CC404|nr:glycosyltransferase family 1 protein [Fusobacterium varium]